MDEFQVPEVIVDYSCLWMFQIFHFFQFIGSGVVKAKMSSCGHFLVILDDKVRCLLDVKGLMQGAHGMYCF